MGSRAQATRCGCPTPRGPTGWTARCRATAASTRSAWPSRASTCRRAPPRAGPEPGHSLPEGGDSAAPAAAASDALGLTRPWGAPARPPRDLAAACLACVPPGPLGACSRAAQQGSCVAGRARCMRALGLPHLRAARALLPCHAGYGDGETSLKGRSRARHRWCVCRAAGRP